MNGRLRCTLGALCCAAVLASSGPSQAQSAGKENPDFARATADFERGSKLFLDKRYEDALEVLKNSHALYPSPNSLLLIARCERELGRLEQSARHFDETAAAADARVSAGEAQYLETADSARNEGAKLRAKLGTVRVKVLHAPKGTVAETRYGKSLLEPDGSAQLVHRGGTAEISVTTPDGRVVRRSAEVTAGSWTDVTVDLQAEKKSVPTPAPAPPVPDRTADRGSTTPSWMMPTGAVLVGVGAVGLASFGYFGLKSRSTYDQLNQTCGPSSCGPAQRDEADRGKREQTIANVSLAVGGVALATGITLVVLALSDHGAKRSEAREAHWTPRGFVF